MTVITSIPSNMESCAFLHSKTASLSQKILFSQKILDGYENQDIQGLNSKRAMLQAYHCREILDWIISRVLGKITKTASEYEVIQGPVWRIVLILLRTTHCVVSPIIITSLAAIIQDLSECGKSDMNSLLEDFCFILEILCEKSATKGQLGLHLEHGASLLKSCLHMLMENRYNKIVLKMASLSSKLFTLHMDRFVVAQKLWDVIVVRQLDAVMFGAFYEDEKDIMDIAEIRLSIQASCRIILTHAMFTLDTLSDLADSLFTSNEDKKESGKSYTSKLLPIIGNKVTAAASGKYDCQVMASMFSWLVKSCGERMGSCRHLIPAKFKNADSLLFFKLAMMVLKIPDIPDGFRMRLLASLTKEIKAAGVYRPTGLNGSDQQNYLSDITSRIFECGVSSNDPKIVLECLQALDGILIVEHRGIEEKLEEYWKLMEVFIPYDEHKYVEHSMELLIQEFSKLRRLEFIFMSLGGGLRNQDSHLWPFLLTSERINESFKYALNHIPSGQTSRFIDCIKVWMEVMHSSSVVYYASAVSLVLENVPVDLNNAGKVFTHTERFLKSIQSIMLQHMAGPNHDMLSSLLVIQTDLVGMCMECSKIDPNIAPLYMQGVRPPFWNDNLLENEFHGSIDIFATSTGGNDCISIPITSLTARAKSLDGQQRARLIYSLTHAMKMHLRVCTEQYQFNAHRVIDDHCCKTEGYIGSLMEVLTDLIQMIAGTYSGNKLRTRGFHDLNLQNLGNAVVECLTSDLDWLQVGIGCLQREQQIKFVRQLLSIGFIPDLAFCMNQVECLMQISRDFLSTIGCRLSSSRKKRKSDGSQLQDTSGVFEFSGLLTGSSTSSKQFYKSIDRVLKCIKGDEMNRLLKKLKGKHHEELWNSYQLAGLLSNLCYSNVRVSQMVRGICLDHTYCSILIMSAEFEIKTAVQEQCAAMIDGFCYQTRLLHAHASPEERSKSNRAHQVFGLYKLAEACPNLSCDICERLQMVVSGEVELFCRADDLHAILPMIKKDNSLILARSFCKLLQKDTLLFSFLDDHYEDIFHQLAKQTKELSKTEEYTLTSDRHISVIAEAASDALPILAVNQGFKICSKLLERMPMLFIACIRELVAEFSLAQFRIGQVRKLCAFVETYTRLLSSIKPRMSWEEYVNVFSALTTLLYVCPKGVGQGHQSRPNAPKEAMIITASRFDHAGEVHRYILGSVFELIRCSTRDECSRLLDWMSLNCIPLLEILLVMLEDSENGVLKDLLENQVDKITYNILQGIHSAPLHGVRNCTASEFLQSIRSSLLVLPHQGKPALERISNGSYSIKVTLAFRCIESIVCRPLRFKKFPKRWIAMVLSTVESASNLLCRYTDDTHYDACFIGISSILVGMMRHQPLSRSLHLMGLAIRSLQNCLFTTVCVSTQKPSPHVIECFSRVLEEFSKIRAVQPYCKDVILTHVKLFMSPITENALEDSLPMSLCDMVTSKKSPGCVVISTDVQEIIAPGICALYGICSANDIQDVYASLGRQTTWQSALNNLKIVYEAQFRYIGKV